MNRRQRACPHAGLPLGGSRDIVLCLDCGMFHITRWNSDGTRMTWHPIPWWLRRWLRLPKATR